jgi:hypothetical protein
VVHNEGGGGGEGFGKEVVVVALGSGARVAGGDMG